MAQAPISRMICRYFVGFHYRTACVSRTRRYVVKYCKVPCASRAGDHQLFAIGSPWVATASNAGSPTRHLLRIIGNWNYDHTFVWKGSYSIWLTRYLSSCSTVDTHNPVVAALITKYFHLLFLALFILYLIRR